MTENPLLFTDTIRRAIETLRSGGVIAYPTEHCFGLGCDPHNVEALRRLLEIKRRRREQGVILIAADVEQVRELVDLDNSPRKSEILSSWPGPNTWILSANNSVSTWVRGRYSTVAMRISAHPICRDLCAGFGGAIVSTSANRHSLPALLNANDVRAQLGVELDYILDAPVGGAAKPSVIRDGETGKQLR